jgi:trk system potassium uptake protein TrkH
MMGQIQLIRDWFFDALNRVHPTRLLVYGYLYHTFMGWFLLSLPFCTTESIPSVDIFFTSISAVTTTGLTTIDISKSFTWIGQFFILVFVQIGGIGFMTFSSFVILSKSERLTGIREKISTVTFSLPREFDMSEFIRNVVFYTFLCEILGSIAFGVRFYFLGFENYIWSGIFHSVMSFCTAGFSLFSDGFIQFKYDFWINTISCTLSLLGAIGFIVIIDFIKSLSGARKTITFTSKVILSITFWFLLIGTILMVVTERSIKGTGAYEKLIVSFFQTMSASTTVGFNTLSIGELSHSTILLLIFLMIFGASPAGTGGGLKSTTFSALVGLVKSTVRGSDTIYFFDRPISPKRIQIATATLAYYFFILGTSVYVLTLLEPFDTIELLFETASALGTVGLTMGVTPKFTELSKVIVASLMLIGRVGILSFGIAISVKPETEEELKDTDLAI